MSHSSMPRYFRRDAQQEFSPQAIAIHFAARGVALSAEAAIAISDICRAVESGCGPDQ